MEQTEAIFTMLDHMERPAFFVRDGRISRVNALAARYLLDEGALIETLLSTGRQEYAEYQGGCLHLTLQILGSTFGATVTRVEQYDMFVMDAAEDGSELQAMALAARELRMPLSNIMSVADRLFPIAGADPDPELQDQIARINRGLFQMLRIVGNMSDAYRYSQDASAAMETRDIAGMLEEWFQSSAEMVSFAGVQLCYTGLSEPVYGLVDPEKLERAVSNIISNAVKFSPKGSCVNAVLRRRGNMLYLTVKDGGSGVPESLRGSVHHRFRREPGIEDQRYGIGLGMVLIRAAAALHGGTVLMENLDGNRLTMTIAIRENKDSFVRVPRLAVDYAGDRDHRLVELSDVLPPEAYRKENIN